MQRRRPAWGFAAAGTFGRVPATWRRVGVILGLLEMFLRHPDHVLSREQIIGQVWGWDVDASSNVVDVFVKSLRAKIGSDRIETCLLYTSRCV